MTILTLSLWSLPLLGGLFLAARLFRGPKSTVGLTEKDRSYDPTAGRRYAHWWGFEDTKFEFCGPRTIRVTGSRYPLAGPELPRFIPFVEDVLGMDLGPENLREAAKPPVLPPSVVNAAFLGRLRKVWPSHQWMEDDEARLVHSHGQLSVEEIYRILKGRPPERVVDLVVFPESEGDVSWLVKWADECDVVLIPYGGGTNVSGALLCPVDEGRMIVSVDMARMNRIVAIDRENNWAVVEAGITGMDLERQLEQETLTCGHIPDSIELSTLGGWIATNASGMKKNRYGNIEDIVLEATLVTPHGELKSCPINPRSATGIHPRHLMFGSEGCLGIITQAVIQVRPLPEVRRYGSVVFRNFKDGIGFLKAVQESGVRPASIRLVNNLEFRLGRSLTPTPSRWKGFVSRWMSRYVVAFKKFDPKTMVACTLVMEGTVAEVLQQQQDLARLRVIAGGLSGGEEGGKRGYRATFAIAYIRDFLNQLGILGETFETSAPWSRIVAITEAVERELLRSCRVFSVSGNPYLSYRISQSYQTGVCLYFTMGFSARGLEDPESVYQKIEHRMREVILEEGGSLSHHHGVGKVRRGFLPRVHSNSAMQAVRAMKKTLDPRNIFAAANHVFGPCSADKIPVDTNR
jgi:alkyldihydroxyacetonephosphate synthase